MRKPFIQVSFFSSNRSKKPMTISVEEFISQIRGVRYQAPVENYRRLREAGQSTEANAVKGRMPGICVAALCEGGHKAEHATGLTGLAAIDLDHTNERTKEIFDLVCTIPYVMAAFVSISGKGIKILVRIDDSCTIDTYPLYYQAASGWIAQHTQFAVDTSGKDLTRMCFVSWDPGAYYNPEAECLKLGSVPAVTETGKKEATVVNTPILHFNVLLEAQQKLAKRGLFYTVGNRNNFLYSLGCLLKRGGTTLDEAVELCAGSFDLGKEELTSCLHSAYATHSEPDSEKRSRSGGKQAILVKEVEHFLNSKYLWRYNVVRSSTEFALKTENGAEKFRTMTTYEENSILRELWKQDFNIKEGKLNNLLKSEFAPSYDPFESYICSLPEWDGVDYIGRLADMVTTTEPAHWRHCLRKWLVAMVGGWIRPETVNHTVLVLIGKQGIYKTTWGSKLLPPELQEYLYTGGIQLGTRDTTFSLVQCGLINYEELDDLSPRELNAFKAMITQPVINERLFYGRNKEYLPHRASFIANGNNTSFLTDATGNRRWLCFQVENILSPHEFPIDYTGLYAQIRHLLRTGYNFWFDGEEIRTINRYNKPFMLHNPAEELLSRYFRKPKEGESWQFLTASDILGRLKYWVNVQMDVRQVGRALTAAKFEVSYSKRGIKQYKVLEIKLSDQNLSSTLS